MPNELFYGSRRCRVMLLMALAMTCAACGMHLRPEASSATVSIAGHWQLQSPDRETLAATLRDVMAQAQAKQDKRELKRGPPGGFDPSGINIEPPTTGEPENAKDAAHGGPMNRRSAWQIREQHTQQEALLNAVLPSKQLQIVQAAQRIELIRESGARRSFDTGGTSTLVTNFAALHIESGWQGNVFVVHSRDGDQGIDIVERYQRQGNALHLQVELSMPDAKAQLFTANYLLQP